jgi:hypothetical protein
VNQELVAADSAAAFRSGSPSWSLRALKPSFLNCVRDGLQSREDADNVKVDA